jgi:hypothetical protein
MSLSLEMDGIDFNDPETVDFLREQLLSPKEKRDEEYLKKFMEHCKSKFQATMQSADLSYQERLQQARAEMADTSVILAHRLQPFIKEYVEQQEQLVLNNKFAVIKATPQPTHEMAAKYWNCYNAWVNSKDDVSIKLKKKEDLGNVNVIDIFTLTFFSTVTSRRQTGDQVFQLVVSGLNSCGKTMIFESPLLEVAHVLTTEKGVSRFNCASKSTILLHDIDLTMLVKGSGTFYNKFENLTNFAILINFV